MIDDEKRLRKRDIINWDFFVEANDPRAFQLIPTIEKLMDIPIPLTSTSEKEHQKKEECEECKYKQAIEEILNILRLCEIVKEPESQGGQEEKGYRVKVE